MVSTDLELLWFDTVSLAALPAPLPPTSKAEARSKVLVVEGGSCRASQTKNFKQNSLFKTCILASVIAHKRCDYRIIKHSRLLYSITTVVKITKDLQTRRYNSMDWHNEIREI